MPIGTDFEIQGDGDIRHVSGSTNYTVLALHRWLQDLADDAQAASGDIMDITVSTPSERSTDNIITLNAPFNIDDAAAEYLYDGSITQKAGDEIYAGLVVVGAVETGTEIQITQDEANLTSHWSTGKNADAAANILNRVIVKVRENGADIDGRRLRVWSRELGDTFAEFSLTMGLGNNTAALFTSADLNNDTDSATIDTWDTIANTEGYQLVDITGDSVGEPYYAQWDRDIYTTKQLYERTKWLARRGTSESMHGMNGSLFRGITHQFDYDGYAAAFTEDDVVVWGTVVGYSGEASGPFTVGEYVEFSPSGAKGKIIYLDDQGATGTLVVMKEPGSGTITTADSVAQLPTGATADVDTVANETALGGSGVLLAVDDPNGPTGTLWIQLISGSAPVDGLPLYQRGDAGMRANANTPITARTVNPTFLGTFTGSAIIGAFGIAMVPGDTTAADQFFDLANTFRQPPNNQLFRVGGLVVGEDRVLVTWAQAGAVDYDQLTLQTTLSSGSETAVVVTAAIPADTPQTGKIRIQLDTGVYREQAYTSWSGSTFQIASADYSGANQATAPRNVFIGYIDKLAGATEETVTLKYSADRTMFVRVRDGGATPIKTFEAPAVPFGSTGGSVTAIRAPDV